MNADSGAPCSPRHLKKKHFIDTIKKGVTTHASSKQLTESAAVACVKLCKVSTYIPTTESTNVTFYLVQCVINDIKVTRMRCGFIESKKLMKLIICRRYYSIQRSHMLVAKDQIARILNS